ncbi:MAG: DNA mismatch repair endonuclease MutL [Bacteroidales bacterium]
MSDIIKLLPDSVANQIAAGEVIQRPASVVKELLENAIDAGATSIKLVIKDSGKTLIQVVDNGCGMTETDARLCFERHATSKIKGAQDLFAIRTMGFRGEALASIAAVAHVELKTRRSEDELGTFLKLEGSQFVSQEECSSPEGSSISVKNLFFNIPARRKFLKSDSAEMRHIVEEFQRVALVYHRISFSLFHNNKAQYQLISGNQKQRIVALFGKTYNERLVPVDQTTEKVSIKGFIGKPEYAKKTRGEQYFFINNRFVKYPYLHHAVENAFHELLPEESFPTYFLYFEVPTEDIDINIHPAKTEVNLQEIKLVYAFLKAAIKQSLGKYNITPTLDFDSDPGLLFPNFPEDRPVNPPMPKIDPTFNPFEQSTTSEEKQESEDSDSNTLKPMYDFVQTFNSENEEEVFVDSNTQDSHEQEFVFPEERYQSEKIVPSNNFETEPETKGNLFSNVDKEDDFEEDNQEKGKILQVQNKYIVSNIKSGLLIIDQQRAHERILYESYLNKLETSKVDSQQDLFPYTIRFSPQDAEIIRELKDDLYHLGFVINDLGPNTFVINGRPADMHDNDIEGLLEGIIESFKSGLFDPNLDRKVNLAKSLSKNMAIKKGTRLHEEQMQSLIDNLFACSLPEVSIDGKPILSILATNEIEERFK